jgi:hypothetical protein
MKQTTGIIIGIIVILALGMLGYAYSQQGTIVAEYTAPTASPSSATPGVGVTVTASSTL